MSEELLAPEVWEGRIPDPRTGGLAKISDEAPPLLALRGTGLQGWAGGLQTLPKTYLGCCLGGRDTQKREGHPGLMPLVKRWGSQGSFTGVSGREPSGQAPLTS